MDIKNLIRDPKRVTEVLEELSDGRLVTTKRVCIYIPTRFAERGLAYIDTENYIVGIYAIVVDNQYYGVSLVNAMINIDPSEINRIKIDEEPYFEFVFIPGSTVFKSVNLVKTDVLTYSIYDEFFSNGKIPWYITYDALGRIFDTAEYHAGVSIGKNKEVTELIASMIARDTTDRTKYFRTSLKEQADLKAKEPTFIGLRNVTYSATNTLNRLGGSYMSQGIVASLVNPAEREERLESILLS